MKLNRGFVFAPCHQEENLVNFRLERTSSKWANSTEKLQSKLHVFILVPLHNCLNLSGLNSLKNTFMSHALKA